MNEKWMEELKHNDAVCFAEKYFPEQSFGDKTERVAELCRIAEKSGVTDCESIRKIVSAQIGKNAMPLNDEMIAPDGRRIIGKKYISDADASKSGACKACLEYAGRIFKWPEEKDKMPVLPRHPNCKCHYEDVYENPTDQMMQKLGKAELIPDDEIKQSADFILSTKEKMVAAKKLPARNKFLLFDGRYFYSSDGELVIEAASGKPIVEKVIEKRIETDPMGNPIYKYQLVFDYSVPRQKQIKIGGIPEGLYYILPSEKRSIQNPKNHILGNISWGDYAWSLHPTTGTNTYGRTGFFIHGGRNFGSAGCIDLQKGDNKLQEYIQKNPQGKFYIYVKYRKRSEQIIEDRKDDQIQNHELYPNN